eukprot:TRINITY_DN7165_c1_g1_i1.p1 TRINITY_DN7165_c1_g1~~TRINITY_DN7165_c1_g1_i1.p1  ORF type:complete len:113 (+),score=16.21 TRINITY_DN7165_c1_g1_i1:57-395(+)
MAGGMMVPDHFQPAKTQKVPVGETVADVIAGFVMGSCVGVIASAVALLTSPLKPMDALRQFPSKTRPALLVGTGVAFMQYFFFEPPMYFGTYHGMMKDLFTGSQKKQDSDLE